MKTATKKSLATILLSAFLLSACGGGNNNGAPSAPPPSAPPGPTIRLYIANNSANSILSYDNAGTVTGNVAPSRTISGANTLISNHYGNAYDSRTNTLIAGDSTAVLFFDNVGATTGNVAPSRNLTGANTGLQPVLDVAVDEARNLLYVGSRDGASVSVFANANTVTGNVAPARVIAGANTLLGGSEKRLFIDSTNDRLYVTTGFSAQVLVFNNASTATGNLAPNRVISGATTTFAYLWGIEVDVGRNLLYVSDFSSSAINIFTNADTVTGNAAPTRRIVGAATTLSGIGDLYVDTYSDTIYQAGGSGNSVLVWNNASTRTGNIAPDRAVLGAATTFSYPTGIVGAR